MLSQLSIHNFALIERLTVNFQSGFNVLTGETGAGKSILIQSLRCVLGDRFESSMLKRGSDSGFVEAVFEIKSRELMNHELLKDYLDGENTLILRRSFTSDGRSKCHINQRTVNLSILKVVGDMAVNIHGQYDHQEIFQKEHHLEVIDRWIEIGKESKKYKEALDAYRIDYSSWKKAAEGLNDLKQQKDSRERELDLLSYQIDEIEQLNPQEGEDLELKESIIRLSHSEKLSRLNAQLLELLSDGDASVSAKMMDAYGPLKELSNIDESRSAWKDRLDSIQAEMEDLNGDIKAYQESMDFEESDLQSMQERLDGLELLKKKYGGELKNVITYLEEAREKHNKLANYDVYLEESQKEVAELEGALSKQALILTNLRKKAAESICGLIAQELKDLEIKNAKFDFECLKGDFNEQGWDDFQFLFCPNQGEELMPLAKIASGGEAARVLLAIKKVIMNVDSIGTLIFDEIDANIGGRLGKCVGEKVRELSKEKQIILITHLPQIAAFADSHNKVVKNQSSEGTNIECQLLNDEESKVVELSQMMSGQQKSSISKEHARQMLQESTS